MRTSESHAAGSASSPGPHHDISSHGFELSAKLKTKLEKLAEWRIHPSSIEFQKDAPEFHGSYATVSRALFVVPSDGEDGTDRPADTKEGVVGLHVLKGKSSSGDAESGGNSNPERRKEGSRRRITMKLRSMGRGLMVGLLGYWRTRPSSSSSSKVAYKTVAVKKMKMSDDVAQILRLTLREAEFLVKLSHPNIIALQGFVEDISNNIIWLVFPWESNGSLRDFIASADWEIPERISLISDVTDGVKYLHSRQPPIRHGDLKSINILVNSESRAMITDFGSASRLTAKHLEKEREQIETPPEAEPRFEATFCESTQTMTLAGDNYTLRWAAPELLNGGEPGLWSDIWALGWVAYEVMTDSIPFQGVGDGKVIMSVIRGDLPSISDDTRLVLIRALCSVMMECWSLDPGKRPTAEEYRKAIDWMASLMQPTVVPDPTRTEDTAGAVSHSPGLLMKLGSMHWQQRDYTNASKYYTKALSVCTDTADSRGKAVALWQLAKIYQLQNEYSQAIAFFSECLQVNTDMGNTAGRAGALYGLAEVHQARKDYSQAITFYSESLQIDTDIDNKPGKAAALYGLAEVHRAQNDYSQAITFYSECLQFNTDIGNRSGKAAALHGLAKVHRARNDYSQASTFYSECLQIRTDIGDRAGRADALQGLAEVHRARNDHSRAITFLSEALSIYTAIGVRNGRAFTLRRIADTHREQDDHNGAIQHYEQAAEVFKQIGMTHEEADVLEQAADLRRLMGQKGPS
ncbi:hypothetical protein FS837_001147 [Tulasnella sp. UAMH 9824]|nr:hypothetical protein FS837_001147 [Tulasnella sp. UAMH 9824]